MQDEQTGWRVLASDSGVQQEVYSWPVPSDPFGGITDEKVYKDIRDTLLNRLNVSLPPAARGVAVLGEFVAKAKQTIDAGQTGPFRSNSTSVGSGTNVALEPNPLLALLHHLEWLMRCFGDRPGISVSIR